MADGFGLVLLTIISYFCLVALFSALRVLFPRVVERTRSAAELLPGRSFVIGLVNILFFGAIASGFTALSNGLGTGIFILPALVILSGLVIGIGLGLTGMAAITGERLFPDEARRKQIAWGAAVLLLASLTPVVGWFGFLPYLCSIGLGGFVLGWFRRAPAQPAAEVQDPG